MNHLSMIESMFSFFNEEGKLFYYPKTLGFTFSREYTTDNSIKKTLMKKIKNKKPFK